MAIGEQVISQELADLLAVLHSGRGIVVNPQYYIHQVNERVCPWHVGAGCVFLWSRKKVRNISKKKKGEILYALKENLETVYL